MSSTGEFELIRWMRSRSARPHDGFTTLGIGDDCAILHPDPGSELVVTTDMLMDGRHFVLKEQGAEAVGYKAMGVNLSDIAAMAAIPRAAFVAVALPRDGGGAEDVARALHAGMADMAGRFGVTLAGGDTNAWDGPLVVCVTLLGETPPGTVAVRRSGAKPGDVIFVTGPLGGSILGRHLRPDPRIPEALALRDLGEIHALIDISDGMISDLGHVLEESGNLGASLCSDSIPVHVDSRKLSLLTGRSALDHALNDGEDFELCVVLGPESAARVASKPSVNLVKVGRILAEPGIRIRDSGGKESLIESSGFDHLKS